MPSSTKTLDAWVIGGRHRHHRTRDHFGADSTLYIAIAQPIGPWPAGTPSEYVLQDLFSRITAVTSSDREHRVFHLNAFVLAPSTTEGGLGVKTLDAVVFKAMSGSFSLRAYVGGGRFTLDAVVAYRGNFYLNAFVV